MSSPKAITYREKKGKVEIQKLEYLENKQSFLDEIKSNYNYIWTIIW